MIKNTAIIGMGALGLLYGTQILKNLGSSSLYFVMDADRLSRYRTRKFTVNGKNIEYPMMDSKAAKPFDLVIVAVKYNELNSALQTMHNCIGKQTIIISVLNGITSERIIAKKYGSEKLLYAVAQGMDAMRFGDDLTYSSYGELLLGIDDSFKSPMLQDLCAYFDKARIPYRLPNDIFHAIWGKFLLNVGINQVCMVYNTTYGGALEYGEPNRTMISAMREVLAIANAEGIDLTEKDINFYVSLLQGLLKDGMPSMAQDRLQHRHSEVDMFAGTVIDIAKKHGILVPTNQFLYNSVKEIEKSY